jgi:hypothetical protein
MFVRWKTRVHTRTARWNRPESNEEYHSAVLVESYRIGEKVKQGFILHLASIKESSVKGNSLVDVAERLNFWQKIDWFLEDATGDPYIDAERIRSKLSSQVDRPSKPAWAESIVVDLKEHKAWQNIWDMVDALRRLLDLQTAVNPLIEALTDKDEWVRYGAAIILTELGDERASNMLLRALNAQNDWLAFRAMSALRRWLPDLLKDQKTIDLVKQHLTREYGPARCEAVRVLGDLGDKQFKPLITPFLNDEDFWTRQEAKKSLSKMQRRADREMVAISTTLF